MAEDFGRCALGFCVAAEHLYVFSYPNGKLVGTINQSDTEYLQGLCSDAKGDVFVTTLSNSNGGNIYDDKGNLFVDGSGAGPDVYFAELPKGTDTLMNVNLSKNINWYGRVQWDGKDITLEDESDSAIYRLKVSGSSATVVGTTRLTHWNDRGAARSWIQNHTIVQPNGNGGREIRCWRYPAGGNSTTKISSPGGLFGVTVSLVQNP